MDYCATFYSEPTTNDFTMADHDTVLKAFLENCEKTPDKPFFTQPMGGDTVKTWTLKETLDEAKKMAAYLEAKNFEKGSKIAICSKNCAWWVLADLASKYTCIMLWISADFGK